MSQSAGVLPTDASTSGAAKRFAVALDWPRLASPFIFVIIVAVWETAVRQFAVPTYILPAPSAVFMALVNGFDPQNFWGEERFYLHIAVTLSEAVIGFVVGVVFGVVLGGMIAQSRSLEAIIKPYIMGFQSLPKVAIAPLVVLWFGFGLESKIVLVALLVFFPLMINSITGFRSVQSELQELMHSLSASRWQLFRMVQVPVALPFIFAGLEMGVVYSLLGAVVGEFVGGTKGLGVLVLQLNSAMDVSGMFATLIILATMGAIASKMLQLVRRRVLYWAPSEQKEIR
ncbi:MAG: ABC transporter permease [Proteobacteria bacterium]|nr:ABC transporter permease [Pseudomonadota bacterium]